MLSRAPERRKNNAHPPLPTLRPRRALRITPQYDGPMPISGNRDSVPLPLSPANLLAADTDPIWDLSFRGIYQDPSVSPTVAALPWYLVSLARPRQKL